MRACSLYVGDPSPALTKRKASAKCIKIKGTDKECVIASSDGAPHNLGPGGSQNSPTQALLFRSR